MNTTDNLADAPVMPNVIAAMRDDGVTIILGGKHIIKTGEHVAAFYHAAMDYSRDKDQESLDLLEEMLFPHKRYLTGGDLSEGPNGEIYFKDTPIPIPATLSEQLFEFLDNDWPIYALRNFWYRAMLNPSSHARDGFFTFCRKYGVTITDNGYALLYKAVTTKTVIPSELDLASLVGQRYLALIANGEDPDQWIVVQASASVTDVVGDDVSYYVVAAGEEFEGTVLGTVGVLFQDIPTLAQNKPTTTYTDKHSRTMDIRLGVPCVKNRSECDPDINQSCSFGLHVGSYAYVNMFGGKSDPIMACLVDPAMVVALPESDDSKIRVCEYLPYALMNRDVEGEWQEIPSSYFESDYEVHDATTLTARFAELSAQLENDLDPEDSLIINNVLSVVTSRLQTLSHVDLNDVADVTQAPNDEAEFDQDNPDAPQNTFVEPNESPDGDIQNEMVNFQAWLTKRQSGDTDLTYEDWKYEFCCDGGP